MLFRWCRSFSGFQGRGEGAAFDQQLQNISSFEGNLGNIANDLNYVPDRIQRVIRSYYFLHASAKTEGKIIVWEKNEVLINSIKKITPLVPDLTSEQVILLIKNLNLLSVKDPNIWAQLENKFIEETQNTLSIQDLPQVCLAFARSFRKNTELWSIFEHKVLHDIPSDFNLGLKKSIILLKAFALTERGGEVLYEKLKENIIENIPYAELKDLMNILNTQEKLGKIEKPFHKLLLDKLFEAKSDLTTLNIYRILEINAKLECDDELLEPFEALFLKDIKSYDLYQLSTVTNAYGKFLIQRIEAGPRHDFMVKVEKYYSKNRVRLLKDLKTEKGNYNEIKVFWGLLKANSINDLELWKSFAKDFENVQDILFPKLKSQLGEILETLKEKQII